MKNLLSRLALVLIGALALATACTKTPEKKLTSTERKALEVQFAALRDTLNGRWAAMIAADDEKIFYTKRILQELSSTAANPLQVEQLQVANDRLKTRRYNQQVLVSDSIDAYDRAQDAVLQQVRILAAQHGDSVRHKIIIDLAQEIQQHDDEVVAYRVLYDKSARVYNDWLKAHRAEVPTAAAAQPVPLFSLSGQ